MIKYDYDKTRYYDKNGKEITEGCKVKYPSGKIEKVYVDNPNLMNVLSGGNPDVGNIRETFFYNQMRVMNGVISSKKADFVIGKYTFEIGGKNKKQKQISDVPNSFVVKDDIEIGHANVIPLWYFGMNY